MEAIIIYAKNGFSKLPLMKKAAIKNELYVAAAGIESRIREEGFKAYFAGGFPRDLLLGRAIKDVDIATSALPDDIERIFPRTFETGKSFGVVNVLHGGFKFEIATFREERGYSDGRRPDHVSYTGDPSLDSARRDFTVNSMFYSPESEEIIDFQGGLDDIARGVVRAVGDPFERFSEDHLRILRAVRFAAEYGFDLDPSTENAIRRCAHLLKRISSERIRDELEKMLKGFDPASAFANIERLGILDAILPELCGMRGTPQDPEYHPEGDVMAHTLLMLSHMVAPSSALAWSLLLHDCGKPASFTRGDDGRCHFYGHEEAGARMAGSILARMKLPSKVSDNAASAVRNHMRAASAPQMRQSKISRMICDENFPDELELHRIDCISSHRKMDSYVHMLDSYSRFESRPRMPARLVTGDDLIGLGLEPGPQFSKILPELHNIQIENPQIGKDELIGIAKEIAEKGK